MSETTAPYAADPAIPEDRIMVLTSMLQDQFIRAGIDELCADEAALAATGLLSFMARHDPLFLLASLEQPGLCPPPGVDGVWREAAERYTSDPEFRVVLLGEVPV